MVLLEARESGERISDAFKMAIISADPARYIPIVFPEWTAKRDDQIGTKDIEDGEGEWVFTDDSITPEMAEQMFKQMVGDADPHPLTLEDVDRFGGNDDW